MAKATRHGYSAAPRQGRAEYRQEPYGIFAKRLVEVAKQHQENAAYWCFAL
jgi:hypothetical protein